jgi:hypothetical protein
VVFGLVEAEEYGITQANVDKLLADSQDPVVMRILGKTEDTGKLLGLDKNWMVNALKAVGNYGEIFERNVGPKTPLALTHRRFSARRTSAPLPTEPGGRQGPARPCRLLCKGRPLVRSLHS